MQLQSVFDALILARVLYASPACRGYLNEADIDCLQQLFGTAPIVSDNYDVSQLFYYCETTIF